MPFRGMKEDISFAGRDIARTTAHDFGAEANGLALVLVRPPSETSHYSAHESRELVQGVLALLAAEPSVRVVYSARHPRQVDDLKEYRWINPPVVWRRLSSSPC